MKELEPIFPVNSEVPMNKDKQPPKLLKMAASAGRHSSLGRVQPGVQRSEPNNAFAQFLWTLIENSCGKQEIQSLIEMIVIGVDGWERRRKDQEYGNGLGDEALEKVVLQPSGLDDFSDWLAQLSPEAQGAVQKFIAELSTRLDLLSRISGQLTSELRQKSA